MKKTVKLNNVIARSITTKEEKKLFERELLINEIAKNVTDMRKAAKLTQEELAQRAETTQEVISRLEMAKTNRMPSLGLLSRIAQAAGRELHLSF